MSDDNLINEMIDIMSELMDERYKLQITNAALELRVQHVIAEGKLAVAHAHKNVINAWTAEKNWRKQADAMKDKWIDEMIESGVLKDRIRLLQTFIKHLSAWEMFLAWEKRQKLKEDREEWSTRAAEGKRKAQSNSPES